MRWLLPLLLSSLMLLALSLSAAGAASRPALHGVGSQVRLPRPVPRVECKRPGTLELRRFEDGSAQLRCARRLLVRVAIPG